MTELQIREGLRRVWRDGDPGRTAIPPCPVDGVLERAAVLGTRTARAPWAAAHRDSPPAGPLGGDADSAVRATVRVLLHSRRTRAGLLLSGMALAAGLVAAYGEPGVVQLKVPTYLIGAGNGSVLLSGRYLKEFEEAGAHVLPSTSQLPLHQSRIAVIFGACPQALGVPRAVMDAMIPAQDMVLADGCPLRTLGSAFGNANIVHWAAAPRQATMSPVQAAEATADRVVGLRRSEDEPNAPAIKPGESSTFQFWQTTKADGTISRGVEFGRFSGPVPVGAAFAGQPPLLGNVWSIVERINAMEGSTGQAAG